MSGQRRPCHPPSTAGTRPARCGRAPRWRSTRSTCGRGRIWIEPSYHPDPNALFDPARGRAEHLDQMAMYEVYGFDAIWVNEFDCDLAQKEVMTFVGDPGHVIREIRAQMRELGAGVIMGLFQFGSLPHALATRNIELFAKAVLPALRQD